MVGRQKAETNQGATTSAFSDQLCHVAQFVARWQILSAFCPLPSAFYFVPRGTIRIALIIGLDVHPGHQLIELVEGGIVDDNPAFSFAVRSELDAHAELAADRLFHRLHVG